MKQGRLRQKAHAQLSVYSLPLRLEIDNTHSRQGSNALFPVRIKMKSQIGSLQRKTSILNSEVVQRNRDERKE